MKNLIQIMVLFLIIFLVGCISESTVTEIKPSGVESSEDIIPNTTNLTVTSNEATHAPNEIGVITVDDQLEGIQLWQSCKHNGFSSFRGDYIVKTPWAEDTLKTVWLRESYIAEKQVLGEMNTKYVYYDPYKEIYYEATELVSTEEEDTILIGTMIYTPVIKNLPPISHNALEIASHIEIKECQLTELFDMPVLYVLKKNLSQPDNGFVKQWISLDFGVVIQEEVYNEDLELVQESVLESMDFEEIPWDVFMPRQDVTYQDRTLSLFFSNTPYSEDFRDAFQSTFMEGYFDIELIDEVSGNVLTLTFNGNQMETMAERQTPLNMHGEKVEVISFREEDTYKVIVPSKEEVYFYPSSVHEHQWFQLDTLGFRKRLETDDAIVYQFEKNDPGSVSGLVNIYDYVIDQTTKKFREVNVYSKDPFSGQEYRSTETVYFVGKPKPSSDKIFSVPTSYNTTYVFSHDDGEHAPPWWE
jgi:hypothetical protein